MASLYDMADALKEIGAQLRAAGAEAEKTTTKIKEKNAVETHAGISSGSHGGSLSVSSTDLGDPRDAEEQAARMIASIRDATRR